MLVPATSPLWPQLLGIRALLFKSHPLSPALTPLTSGLMSELLTLFLEEERSRIPQARELIERTWGAEETRCHVLGEGWRG